MAKATAAPNAERPTPNADPLSAWEGVISPRILSQIECPSYIFPEYSVFNTDCITGMARYLLAGSVQLCVSSIPFGALFQYSGKTEDIGNNQDGIDMRASQFGLHMRFFVEQLLRVMEPGCNVCIHIQQLLRYLNQHGSTGRRDFLGAVRDLFEAGGFEWKGEFVIPKNPQVIAKRLNLHSLMFVTGRKNARDLAPAVNDYVLVFQKPGDCVRPVPALYDTHRNPGGWVTQNEWIKWAKGVWDDIQEGDVLDNWQHGREEGDEKHVCPLQLSVNQRCIRLYTNPGEVVLDPFGGIGSMGHVALGGKCHDGILQHTRRVVMFETKESYYELNARNCQKVLDGKQPTLDIMPDGLAGRTLSVVEARNNLLETRQHLIQSAGVTG